jgi:endoglucanase
MNARMLGASLMVLGLTACGAGGATPGGGGGGGVIVAPTPTPAATPTPTPTPTPAATVYTPAAAAAATTGIHIPVGKCVNMGNHLEAPNEGDWGRAIVDGDFAIIKAAGFDTVRIPVRWSAHAMAGAPYTIDATFMARVEHVVTAATGAGLNVILNVHHYEELFQNPSAHATRFAELWKQIASRFAGAPSTVWFELINEPNNNLNDTNLLTILNPALANVRATNATRPVIVGGQNWSGVDSLATLVLPSDPYVVPTIHTYDPFDFTHQGATWVTPTPALGRVFGSAADYNNLNANLQKVRDYITRTGRVPFVGEYGAIDDPGVPLSERIKYYNAMTTAYASIGIQTCAWGYTNTFRLRDGSNWLPGMLDAIKTTTTLQ